jgi:hypothetical protein
LISNGQLETDEGGAQTIGATIIPSFGWKIDVGAPGGFFINPGIRFPLSIGKQWPFRPPFMSEPFSDFYTSEQTGVSFNVVVFIGLGYAF